MTRIVLAYSGDVESSAAIPWLIERYGAEIIAVTVDIGQPGNLEAVRNRALTSGAVRAHVLDARDEFARDFLVPSLQADALYDDRYPLIDALGAALVARKLVEIADIEHATAVAYGGAGRESPLTAALHALRPGFTVMTPALERGMTAAQTANYLAARHIPPSPRLQPGESNIWGRAVPCGIVDDAWREAPDDLYTLTKSGADCPNEPAFVEIAFERGVPAAINGVAMPLVDLVGSLLTIAGAHGVGRLDLVETIPPGHKARTIYEAPAAVVLHAAHRELQKHVVGRDVDRFSRLVRSHYGELIRTGNWYSPLRAALDAYVRTVQEQVTGVVRLKLFKGACRPVGRKSPHTPAKQAVDGRESPVTA